MKTLAWGGWLVLLAFAPAATAFELDVSTGYERTGLGFDASADVALADESTQEASQDEESTDEPSLFSVDAFLMAWWIPSEFVEEPAPVAASAVSTLLELVPESSALAALWDDGAEAQASAQATERQASVSSSIQAGSVSTASNVAQEVPRAEPRRGSMMEGADRTESEPRAPPTHDEATRPKAAGPETILLAEPPAAPDAAAPLSPAAAAATAVVSGGALLVAAPGWRHALWRLLRRVGGLLLFSRIAQEDILNHERRSELVEFVQQNPGERVEIARRTLGFSNGSMHYHLRVLSQRGVLRIVRQDGVARLYRAGPKIEPQPYVPRQRRRYLHALSDRPGATQRELAQALGVSERMASYHVHALERQGLVEVRMEGPRRRLFARPQASDLA